MKLFKALVPLKKHLDQQNLTSLGLVPTMGALHDGHLALVRKAVEENEKVVVTIFVNPTQFDDQKDLDAYPKTLEDDLEKLACFGEQIAVYAPEVEDLYPKEAVSEHYDFGELETTMEGGSRKGHFQGVATIVQKLLKGFMPTRAYFGEKDYQQLAIIHALVQQKELPIEIVDCPIVREKDGLAMSSRNRRLSEKQRAIAPQIYSSLTQVVEKKHTHSIEEINRWVIAFFEQQAEFELDYFCIADARSLQPLRDKNTAQNARAFIAVKMGEIRLIDNVKF
jgi:pantoate--beta-alanine ligase